MIKSKTMKFIVKSTVTMKMYCVRCKKNTAKENSNVKKLNKID